MFLKKSITHLNAKIDGQAWSLICVLITCCLAGVTGPLASACLGSTPFGQDQSCWPDDLDPPTTQQIPRLIPHSKSVEWTPHTPHQQCGVAVPTHLLATIITGRHSQDMFYASFPSVARPAQYSMVIVWSTSPTTRNSMTTTRMEEQSMYNGK